MAKKSKAKKAKLSVTKSKSKAKKPTKKVATKKAATPAKKASAKKTKIKTVASSKKPAMAKPVQKKKTDWQIYLAPLYDKVLLQKEVKEIISAAGLYLGDAKEDSGYAKAKVLAVGKGLLSKKGQVRPLDVKEGDTVLFSSYAGSTLKVDGKDLVIVREEEILGVMEK